MLIDPQRCLLSCLWTTDALVTIFTSLHTLTWVQMCSHLTLLISSPSFSCVLRNPFLNILCYSLFKLIMKGPSFSICHNNFLVNGALLEENGPHYGNIHREAFPLSISSYSLFVGWSEQKNEFDWQEKLNYTSWSPVLCFFVESLPAISNCELWYVL